MAAWGAAAQGRGLVARPGIVCALLCGSFDAGVEIHVSGGAGTTTAPAHRRTLRAELARQLDRVPDSYTVDVAIVQLAVADVSAGIEVRAELRALVSDVHGVAMWTSTARAIAIGVGFPITSTSANRSGAPPASTAREVIDALGDLLAVVVDAGSTRGGPPSTIVDVTAGTPRLVRAGAVDWDRVLESLE